MLVANQKRKVRKRRPACACVHCGSDNTTVGSSGKRTSDFRWVRCHDCGKWMMERKR